MVEFQASRLGGFQRIFPTASSWAAYSEFLEDRSGMNFRLHSALLTCVVPTSCWELCLRICHCSNASFAKSFSVSFLEKHIVGANHILQSTFEERNLHYHTMLEARVALRHPGLTVTQVPPKRADVWDSSPLLAHAATMTTGEIRRAFSTYLRLLQRRLGREGQESRPISDVGKAQSEDQMVLISKFLLRAAANLPASLGFRLEAFSAGRLSDRQLQLSAQLARFVLAYEAETARLFPAPPNETVALAIAAASEEDLEAALAEHSRRGRSEVFLGSRPAEPSIDDVLSRLKDLQAQYKK